MSLSLDLQDPSSLLQEDNYNWMHISPLASIKMSNSGSACDRGFVLWLSVSHEFEQGPHHLESSREEEMPGPCQAMDELGGSPYHPLAIFSSSPAQLTFRYLTYGTAPLAWERRVALPALLFSVTFASLICRPTPPDQDAQESPKKTSCFPAEGGLLVPVLESCRHLDIQL